MGNNYLGLTVSELYKLCEAQIKKGNAEKHVLISDDDEGNGYHTLFYGFTSKASDLKMMLPYEHDGSHTVKNCVILG